jgi:L-iditol 2-dehydrogenase
LIEPLACVVRGLEEAAPRAGDTVAILGLGPIGLMFVRLAHLYGCRVIAIGRRKTQLDRAGAMGADELVRADQHSNTVQAVRDLTGGRGADVAIEAVGKPETWHWVVDMVRRGGTVNFFGGCPNDSRVMLDTNLLHYSEITCKASFHHTPLYIRKALDLVTRGDITSRDFVNCEEPLTNLLEVMRHLMSHNGHLKTAIIP